MAAAIFADMLRHQGHNDLVCVRSAGIWATEGEAAMPQAQTVMHDRGLDISSHRAHHLTLEDIRQADLIVAMECSIAETLAIEDRSCAERVHHLGELADVPRDVEDPIGRSLEDYRYTADVLHGMMQRAYSRILSLIV